tara:strand:+ start:4759 stop:5307 length:549 start_codon:yes stop_codon:yes gene_type:complete
MPEIATIMAVVGTAASVGGTIVQAGAYRKQGISDQAAANYEAAQLDLLANEEYAAAQRESLEVGRQTDILQGRGRAVAAASGAGASDVTVRNIQAEVQNQGDYRQNLAMYGGAQRRLGLRAQAEATRMAGRASLQGSKLSAFGTILGGFGNSATNAASFFQSYGGGNAAAVAGAGNTPGAMI